MPVMSIVNLGKRNIKNINHPPCTSQKFIIGTPVEN
jgi:hypothetical protein